MRNFLTEPLLHFCIAGALLFFIDHSINDRPDGDELSIVVDRSTLLSFFQLREKMYDSQESAKQFELLSTLQLQYLSDEFVRDEALYREALGFGLDQNDGVIKNRLIQKMEFIAEGLAFSGDEVLDRRLVEDYFLAHKSKYFVQPTITFAHVFFSFEQGGQADAKARSSAELASLIDKKVPFHQATKYGDRFRFHTNYVNREPDFISRHFGEAFAGQLFTPDLVVGSWQGPLQSRSGYHLVFISTKTIGYYPELEDIVAQVTDDLAKERRGQAKERAIEDIVNKYHVDARSIR